MEKDVEPQRHEETRRQDSGEFAALFAQLDCPDAAAAIDRGLVELTAAINRVRYGTGFRH